MSMKPFRLVLAALGATVALAAVGSEARAQHPPQTSPFGPDTPTRVIIGSSGGQQIILWRSLVTNQCITTVIGGAGGLSDSFNVFTSETVDNVWVPDGNWTTASCGGRSGGPLNYAGHFLDVHLGAGNDGADMGSGDSWVFGNHGDDRIWSANPTGRFFGGEGADRIRALGSGVAHMLFGEGGNDCLTDDNGAAGAFDCGTGFDRYMPFPGSAPGCEAEIIIGSC